MTSPEHQAYLEEQLRYDSLAERHSPNSLAVFHKQHQLVAQAVAAFAAGNPVHMLDVGCGGGDFARELAPWLTDYIGIEPSETQLRRFEHGPGRRIVRGFAEQAMDFLRDGSRTFVLLNSVLDHAFDAQVMFRQCVRVLTPGGLLVLSMENAEKLPVLLRRLLGRPIEHAGHLSFWGFDEVSRLLNDDFETIEARTIGHLYGWHRLTLAVPVPSRLLRAANTAADTLAGFFSPRFGHVLFFAAVKKGAGEPANLDAPFRCPKCLAVFGFETQRCGSCGLPLPRTGNALDAMAVRASL